jgi:diguanylate cyclase (GGDEF)-like protein
MHPSLNRDYRYLLAQLIPRHLLSSQRLAGIAAALESGERIELVGEAYRALEELVAKDVFRRDGVTRTGDGRAVAYRRTDFPATITLVMTEEEWEAMTRGEAGREEILPSVLAGIISSLALNDSPKTFIGRIEEMLTLAPRVSPGARAMLLFLNPAFAHRETLPEGIAYLSLSDAMRRPLYRSSLASGMSHAFIRLAGGEGAEDAFGIAPGTRSIVFIPLAAHEMKWAVLEIQLPTSAPPDRNVLSNFQIIGQGILRLLENNKHLEKMVSIDRLTQVYNRNHYESQLPLEIERANRTKASFAFLIMDVDDFKKINDTYGHDVGDRVLRVVAQTTRRHLRKIDLLFRYGGEEFIVLLPGAKQDSAKRTAERIREVISKAEQALHGGSRVKVTVSIGGCIYPDSAQNEEQLFRMADRALYEAKEGGKNKVQFCEGSAG